MGASSPVTCVTIICSQMRKTSTSSPIFSLMIREGWLTGQPLTAAVKLREACMHVMENGEREKERERGGGGKRGKRGRGRGGEEREDVCSNYCYMYCQYSMYTYMIFAVLQ